jgi:ubiquinone biosynthesis protein COQ9
MIDTMSDKGRAVAAAMRLAAERPWNDVSLLDIAHAAGLGLVDLKQHFVSKADVLAAFMRAIDDDMLRRAPARTPDQTARDALFEVVMSRFDALTPYRPALRSIARSGLLDPRLVRAFLSSQHWMLQASGVNTDGVGGCVRLAGFGSVYASVFETWLDDDDPGHSRTMAALDRRLRSGERSLRLVDDAIGFAGKFICALTPFGRGMRGARERPTDEAARPVT